MPATLAESERLYPFPERERVRTCNRKWILQHVPKGGTGAEIGVFRGHFSEVLLEHLKPRKAYFVDPWRLCGETFAWGGDYTANRRLPTAVARQDAMMRAARFAEVECRFVEGYFPACRDQFEEPLDWIYLDAAHDYESTLEALGAAAELLAPRGILFGDDWWPEPTAAHHGVFQAINKFVKASKFDLVAAGPFGQWALRRRGPWTPSVGEAQQGVKVAEEPSTEEKPWKAARKAEKQAMRQAAKRAEKTAAVWPVAAAAASAEVAHATLAKVAMGAKAAPAAKPVKPVKPARK